MEEKTQITLATPVEELTEEILKASDMSSLNDIVDIFNVNLKKKDIIRAQKLSEVQDKVVQQMYDRMDQRADEFSNADLIQMHKAVQDTINKTDSTLDNIKAPTIQINQQINVAPEFNRDSRMKILDVVNQILNTADKDSEEEVITDVQFTVDSEH